MIAALKNKNFFPLLIVIFFGLLAAKGLMGEGYFNMHDDLQMMRQLSMEKCFLDGQIPCRWIPDMGYGFGYPLFNFYPPLPYLVGELFRILGYTFAGTVKIIFSLSFVLSGITMYFLAKEFFGKFGGIISSIFYVWAPYHAVDVYVRGAMNEAWALIWFPIILLAGYKLIANPISANKKPVISSVAERSVFYSRFFRFSRNDITWIIILALSWFGLFTSHNLMVLIFGPIFAFWCLLWLVKSKNFKKVVPLAIAGAWSFGLAAFFTLPVLLEKGAVQTDTLVVGYYEYTAHFVDLNQLFISRFWGFGPSVWGEVDDGMPFQIGWVHWLLTIPIGLLLVKKFFKNKKYSPYILATIYLILAGWTASFMAHSRSTPIWQNIKPLEFVQFPWRFLTIVILGFSFAAGSLTKLLPKHTGRLLTIILIPVILIYSWNYFLPEHGKLGPLTDEEKFSGAAWELQQTAGIFDYLPNTAFTAPKEPRKQLVEVREGEATVTKKSEGTNWANFEINVQKDAVLRIGLLKFPGWKATIDGAETEIFIPEDEQWGRMHINISEGIHEVRLRLHNTPPRTIGNLLSLASWLALAGVIILRKKITSPHKV